MTSPARLDAFLAENCSDCSRGQLQKCIKAGDVQVNGTVQKKPSHQLQPDDVVAMADSALANQQSNDDNIHIEAADLLLEVLYEDEACMVVNKPAGYAVHPGDGMSVDEKTILHGIAYLLEERAAPFVPGSTLVHRLDKDTTGCILVAKTVQAHAELQHQFKDRTVEKVYLALVAGVPKPATAMIDSPIGRNLTDRTRMSVLKTSVSRDAQTTYRTLASHSGASLLECDLHTGRTHQVRVHLHSIGHPILGDTTYTSSESNTLTKDFAVRSLCLHAYKLDFTSPASGERITVQSKLPDTFISALEAAGMPDVLP